ncbi:MAG: helix-turn-helix domain-containing protein [Candidatus Ornithospirochaeta sp.]
MFDTLKTAKTIREARTKKNMTQMELSDLMGVSYQAVSNWERGISMPDISKLTLLSEVLGIGIEEILGGDKEKSTVVEKVLKEESVNLEEIETIAPIVPPLTMEKVVEKEKEKGKVSLSSLCAIAPFIESSVMEEIFETINDVNIDDLVALAPFLESEQIYKLAMKSEGQKLSSLVALAPFLEGEQIASIAEKCETEGDMSSLTALAPFMESEDISKMFKSMMEKGKIDSFEGAGFFCHMDEDEIDEIFEKAIKDHDIDLMVSLAPFSDDDDLGERVVKMVKSGEYKVSEIVPLCPFMDEDHMKDLVKAAIKNGDVSSLSEIGRFL